MLSGGEEMATPTTVKVSKKYQIAVPATARAHLNIDAGDRLLVDIQDGMLILIPEPHNYTDHLAGLHHEVWERSNTTDYIHQERSAWEESQTGLPDET
jgi:AbrB family looped-hinge helix DNA binding protein